MTTLDGVDWRLVAYADDTGALQDVPAGIAASARFEGGRVSGSGGCNRFSGPWAGSAGALAIGPLAGTMMACEGEAMAIEGLVLRWLGEVARAVVTADGLDLLAGDSRVLLRYVASRVTLAGVAWNATGVNNGRGGVQSLVDGTEITATFGDDGHVAGSAGCNRYGGTWTVHEAAITIGPLATTRRLCPGPEGLMEQEAAFFAAMGRVAAWRLDGDQLELRAADGALQVSFRAG
jgi:heat shock protein HslJ